MKEFLKSIPADEYHSVIYPSIVRREMVGQLTLDGGILFSSNPERYGHKYDVELKPNVAQTIPKEQGRFWNGKY